MKKAVSKILAFLLSCVMMLSFVACSTKNPPQDPTPDVPAEDPSDTPSGGDNTQRDYTVTFNYGFDPSVATLDENGKPSAYTSKLDTTSKNGNKVNLTTAMKNRFAVDGYQIIGYSTMAWNSNGITSDLDVNVLYSLTGEFTITFNNPDGSKITTLTKTEGSSLLPSEYPAVSDVTCSENKEFIGWDVSKIDSVSSSVTITALEGTVLKLEAEKSSYKFTDKDGTVVISTVGNGGKSVYLNNGTVQMDFAVEAESEVELYFDIAIGYRGSADNKPITDSLSISLKQAGESEFAAIETEGTYSNKNWTEGDDKKWGDFGTANIGKITLKQGVNTIRLTGMPSHYANVDYIALKGDTDGVYMNAHTLTLSGAVFANGNTTMKISEGSGLPAGIIVDVPLDKKLAGWTDEQGGTTAKWGNDSFIMPESDVTIYPVFSSRVNPSKNVKATTDTITIDGTKDSAYVLAGSAPAGKIGGDVNPNLNADIYMAHKDNGVYVYIEVEDDYVCSRGSEFFANCDKYQAGGAETNMTWIYSNAYKNDMVEFWFEYGDIHSKLQFDAFGYRVRSDADGLATTFVNLNNVQYKTKLIGDDNLDSYKTSGAPTKSTTATGYAVEFFIPLENAGTNLEDKSMLWTVQINSINEANGEGVSVYGWKLKSATEMEEVEKVMKANFVAADAAAVTETLTVEAEKFLTGVDKSGNDVTSTIVNKGEQNTDGTYKGVSGASGNQTVKLETKTYHPCTLTYKFNATSAQALELAIVSGYRSNTPKIADCFTIKVNGVEVTIADDVKFTLEPAGMDLNNDGTSGKYNAFEQITIGNINFVEGENTIEFIQKSNAFLDFDCFKLTGIIEGITHTSQAE